MAGNPFDQFDTTEPIQALAPAMANPFDQFEVATHPVSGPSGDLLKDAGRIAGTAATNTWMAAPLALPHMAAEGVDWLAGKVGLNPGAANAIGSIKAPGTNQPLFPDYQTAKEMAFNTTGGTEYQPQTYLGRRGMDALQGVMGAPFSGGMRAIPALAGGSATAGAAAEAFPNHPLLAAMLGFIPGAYVGNKLSNFAVPPARGNMDPETATLAREATQTHEIPLASGQLSTNPVIRFAYSEGGKLPFSGSGEFGETQRGAFNRAVSRTFGENAERITPEVLQNARDRIGDVFNGVAQRTAIPMSDDFLTGLQAVIEKAKSTTSADSIPAIERQALNVVETAANNGGNLGGRAYLDLTAKGGPIDNMLQSGDVGIRQAGAQLRGLIDDHLAAAAAPQDVGALQQARAQWKALRTVEPLTVRADAIGGAAPSVGDISPASLRAAVNQSYKMSPRDSLGTIPLNDLSKIGQRFLKEPQDSGTATRSLVHNALGGAGALVAGHEAGLPLAASALGTAGTLGANRLVQSLMRTPWLANRQIAASLNPNGFQFSNPSPLARALLPAALGNDRMGLATSPNSGRP